MEIGRNADKLNCGRQTFIVSVRRTKAVVLVAFMSKGWNRDYASGTELQTQTQVKMVMSSPFKREQPGKTRPTIQLTQTCVT